MEVEAHLQNLVQNVEEIDRLARIHEQLTGEARDGGTTCRS